MLLLKGDALAEIRNRTAWLLVSVLLHMTLVFFLLRVSADPQRQSLGGAIPAQMSVTLVAAGSLAMRQLETVPQPAEEPVMVGKADEPDFALADQGQFAQHTQSVPHEEKVKPKPKPKKQPRQAVRQQTPKQPVETAQQMTRVQAQATAPADAPAGEVNSNAGNGGQDQMNMRGGGQGGVVNRSGNGQSDNYAGRLLAEIERHKLYPRNAKRLNQQGSVTVGFMLAADGSVSHVIVLKSSGSRWLDEASVQAVTSARSVGPAPQDMQGQKNVVLNFNLKNNDDW